MGWFAEVCRRRGLKVNGGKSKVMVLKGEEGLEYGVYVDGIRLEQAQMGQNAVEGWRAGGGLQVLSGPWLRLGICSLNVLES